jgi:hypothetical protein
MRDSARFHFGFTVPFIPHMGAAGVVAAVSQSKGDLGLVPAFAAPNAASWWTALEFDTAPKIIARLPFIDRADHPAALPVFVVSRANQDAMVTEVEVWSLHLSGWSANAAREASAVGEIIAVPDPEEDDGAVVLVSLPAGRKLDDLSKVLVKAGAKVRSSALVGSHATRYTVPAGSARSHSANTATRR